MDPGVLHGHRDAPGILVSIRDTGFIQKTGIHQGNQGSPVILRSSRENQINQEHQSLPEALQSFKDTEVLQGYQDPQ